MLSWNQIKQIFLEGESPKVLSHLYFLSLVCLRICNVNFLFNGLFKQTNKSVKEQNGRYYVDKCFKILWKKTFLIKPETLLELTSTKIFFKDFRNTLRKHKLKQKGLEIFRTFAFPRK